MQFAEHGQNGLAQTQRARPTRVEPGGNIAGVGHQVFDWCAVGFQRRQRVFLDVEGVDRAAAAGPVARLGEAHAHAGNGRLLAVGLGREEPQAGFEQGDIAEAPVVVPPGGEHEVGQQ